MIFSYWLIHFLHIPSIDQPLHLPTAQSQNLTQPTLLEVVHQVALALRLVELATPELIWIGTGLKRHLFPPNMLLRSPLPLTSFSHSASPSCRHNVLWVDHMWEPFNPLSAAIAEAPSCPSLLYPYLTLFLPREPNCPSPDWESSPTWIEDPSPYEVQALSRLSRPEGPCSLAEQSECPTQTFVIPLLHS